MPHLKPKELCPIHRRRDCCGRSEVHRYRESKKPNYKLVAPGVRVYDDGHTERSPAALKLLKDRMLMEGHTCEACDDVFSDYADVELAHRKSKGINGWKRDDSVNNLCLLHVGANRACGSMDLETYLATKWKPEHCNPNFSKENT